MPLQLRLVSQISTHFNLLSPPKLPMSGGPPTPLLIDPPTIRERRVAVYFREPKASYRASLKEWLQFVFTNCARCRLKVFESLPIQLPHISLWLWLIELQWLRITVMGQRTSCSLKAWYRGIVWLSKVCAKFKDVPRGPFKKYVTNLGGEEGQAK